MNHRQIEAFRAVFQTASMTAAGALMGITQPAVSRLIRDLEAETALKLFDRSAGKLIPTPDAVALSREVERSYQGLDRVARAAAELGRRREGALRIAASVAPSVYGLPPVLAQFHAAWPGVSLSLHTGSSPEVLDLVAMRHCDLGVAVLPAEGPGVTIEALPVQNAVCVLPARHPLASRAAVRASDLAGVPMLMISAYSHLRQGIMRNFAAMDVQPDIVFEVVVFGSDLRIGGRGIWRLNSRSLDRAGPCRASPCLAGVRACCALRVEARLPGWSSAERPRLRLRRLAATTSREHRSLNELVWQRDGITA